MPTGLIEFSELVQSEGVIKTTLKGKRGVYLWTNKINGHQYIGSAMDLSARLSDYFSKSYIKAQSKRGSAISLAIAKYGYDEFTLQVLVLGSSPIRENISVNSDHILLEQYYLDRYLLIYNVRRVALGPAPTYKTNEPKIMGENNPQFGKLGSEGAAWANRHSEEQRAIWSLTRSTPIFIYDNNDLTFKLFIYGYERLANYLDVHINTAKRAAKSGKVYTNPKGESFIISLVELTEQELKNIKINNKPKSTIAKAVHVYNKDKTILLKTFNTVSSFITLSKQSGSSVKLLCESDALWLGEYFLSYELLPSADNSLNSVGIFNPKLNTRKLSIPVYSYSADGKTFIKYYSSLRNCVKELEGNRNFNTKTLELCIKHKELYHGFIVSDVPLFDHLI